MIGRRILALAGLAALAVAANAWPVAAQSYPARPIKLVVPFTPGSPNDVMARLVVQHLQPRLGQPIVVENKPGGGTTIGTKAVASAPADGYTLLFISSALVIDPAMKKVEYDPTRDFAPIATVGSTYWLLAVSPALPVTNVTDFVAYTKANPGKVTLAYTQGTAAVLVGESFKRMTGADILAIPYKGGAAAMPDFLGGRIQMLIPTPSTTIPLIREGKMRALAITSPARSPNLPDVPTAREAGIADLTLEFWAGILAPAGTPRDIVGKLNSEINAALRSPEMTVAMDKLGIEAKPGSPEDFSAFLAAEIPRWGDIVKSSGVKFD